MRTLKCAVAAVAFLLIGAPAALAHQGNPNYRSVVKYVNPPVKGVTVSVLNFDDRLLLHNTSGQDVTIYDYTTPPKPYAQVKADGTVLVNTNSPAYYINGDRTGTETVPPGLPSTPNWKLVSRAGRFDWHDHRMHWMGTGLPPAVKDKSKVTKIDDWTVPIKVGKTNGTIGGTLTWVGKPSEPLPLGAIFAFAALLILLALALFFIRRRRDPDPVGPGDKPSKSHPEEVVEAW
jgi:hypothetical protein